MADLEKVMKGLKKLRENSGCLMAYSSDCKTCPYLKVNACCDQVLTDALELLKAYKQRRALEGHNISNVDIPDGVEEAQFHAVMYNVVAALEHTDKGESWPYDEEGREIK